MSRIQTMSSGFAAETDQRIGTGTQSTLELNVVFTTEQATVSALRYAAQLADGLGVRLQLVVPQVVPYGRDLNDPDVNPEFIGERAGETARKAGVEANVNVVLCRDRVEGLHRTLSPDGVVVIGGDGHWWSYRERELVRGLSEQGHKVVFAEGEQSK